GENDLDVGLTVEAFLSIEPCRNRRESDDRAKFDVQYRVSVGARYIEVERRAQQPGVERAGAECARIEGIGEIRVGDVVVGSSHEAAHDELRDTQDLVEPECCLSGHVAASLSSCFTKRIACTSPPVTSSPDLILARTWLLTRAYRGWRFVLRRTRTCSVFGSATPASRIASTGSASQSSSRTRRRAALARCTMPRNRAVAACTSS